MHPFYAIAHEEMNKVKPETPNTSSWENVPHDIMVPVPIKMHPPVILDHNLPLVHNAMPMPQTPHVCSKIHVSRNICHVMYV